MNGVDWGNLPEDLLDLTFRKLRHAGDVIRFEAVCTSWNRVSSERRRRPLKLPSPILLLPPTTCFGFHRFRDHSNNKVGELKFQFPEALWWRRCPSSCNGWLVFQSRRIRSMIILINPMTRKQIHLPAFQIKEQFQFIRKAVASSSPLDPNCTIIAIYDSYASNLAFCKPGDKSWKVLPKTDHQPYCDIVYHKDKFYALNCFGVLHHCEINGDISVMQIAGEDRQYRCRSNKRYLVESSRDLLQIFKKVAQNGCFIRKMDFERREWIEVKSLGKNALFLGKDQSFGVSTVEFCEFTAECIYFLHEPCRGCCGIFQECDYVVLYNVKTFTTKLLSSVPYLSSRSSWITPDLTLPT